MSGVPAPAVLYGAQELRAFRASLSIAKRPVVFVPTMGDLHAGHLSLVRHAADLGPVIVSIFVNPTQFGEGEDFDRYPRNLEVDRARLATLGVAAIFAPAADEIYNEEAATWVDVDALRGRLCDAHRPGHFRGVTTVVTKLFNLVQPDVAVFGQKDAQQCLVLYRMVRDLHLPIEMVVAPTVRDDDGLALSSRNRFLSSSDRRRALGLSRALRRGVQALAEGVQSTAEIEQAMAEVLVGEDVDYLDLRSLPRLDHEPVVADHVVLAGAMRISGTRLIDNISLRRVGDRFDPAPLIPAADVNEVADRLRERGTFAVLSDPPG